MAPIRVVCIEDESEMIDLVNMILSQKGYEVIGAPGGLQGLQTVEDTQPELVLLDLMMPDMDGIETCREIREQKGLQDVIIAFLTARSEDYTQIAGFEVGADDYITKPIKPRVFISRIKALLRRLQSSPASESNQEFGDVRIDKEKHAVFKAGVEIALPKKEFKLFALLSSKPGKVFTREYILDQVWGDEVVVGDRTIDVHIRKLREKIDEDLFKTIKGVGYKLEV